MTGGGARRGFAAVAAALTASAWAILWLGERGPYGRYLAHGGWTDSSPAAPICRLWPAAGTLLPATIYVGGWLLMTTAMMLPTTWPLIDRFDCVVAARPNRRRLTLLVVAGYLTVWAGFGLLAHLADTGLHEAVRQSPWLLFNGWPVGTLILAIAGAFQFSRLKYRCLARCRTPLSFIAKHWHGRTPSRDAFLLGLDHGLFCVGCCWALMLVMFVVGTGNLGWMLALGAVMALEKNTSWGLRLSRPLGAALFAGAVLLAVVNLST
jgi:predicted metal-binding membrane protein